MKGLLRKVWGWYTGNTYVRHTVTTVLAYTIVHYADFLTTWAPASDQALWTGIWTAAGAPIVRLLIKWAEAELTKPRETEDAETPPAV